MDIDGPLLIVMVVMVMMTHSTHAKYAFNCKFSNEGCERDEECCSGRCLQAHSGTNPRCTRSALHSACLYNYQCEDRHICGPANTCCSKYWGTCSRHEDCCHPQFRCMEADGFYYKRCLTGEVPSSASEGPGQGRLGLTSLLPVLLASVASLLLVRCYVTAGDSARMTSAPRRRRRVVGGAPL